MYIKLHTIQLIMKLKSGLIHIKSKVVKSGLYQTSMTVQLIIYNVYSNIKYNSPTV